MVKKGQSLPRYDWDDKRDICHQLYVEEKKTIPEIVQYFANHFQVTKTDLPSAKVFHRQFTEKWGFPRRRAPLDADIEKAQADLMIDLWQRNVQLKDIFQALLDQGHEMNHYDFSKLRKKYGLNRRGDSAYAPLNSNGKRLLQDTADGQQGQDENGSLDPDIDAAVANAIQQESEMQVQLQPQQPLNPGLPPLSAEEQARRVQRLQQVQMNSDEQMSTRKRRRRIRGFGHLSADAESAEPRYGSETSLDECKAYLKLDNELYLDIRQQFDAICREMDIERKRTSLEDGRWQTSKDRLVRNNQHLAAIMNPLQPHQDQKELALDLIWADVKKPLADPQKQLTIAGANNLLGLNPAASKDLRRSFYKILEADHYTTRLACGDEHWKELRHLWHSQHPLLTRIYQEKDPQMIRAVDLLCRDASKRYNDDKTKQDPSRKLQRQQYYGPGPGAATHRARVPKAKDSESATPKATPRKSPNTPAPAPANTVNTNMTEFNPALDPALMAAAQMEAQPSSAIPAYFRLSPNSMIMGQHPQLWLARLDYPNIMSLQAAATMKLDDGQLRQVYGVINNLDGTQMSWRIDSEDELTVYLEAAGGKPTFLVTIEGMLRAV